MLMPVAHTYNPSYSGGRDQEDRGSRVSLANSQKNPILKILNIIQYQKRKKERKTILNTKKGLAEWLKW
jgi:hypothetical protein